MSVAAEPTPEQVKLLKTFCDEFVTIAPRDGKLQSYSIGKYEVPQNLWQAVMGSNPSRWKGARNSVEMLNLEEAQAFCGKATEQMQAAGLIERGQMVRLPTEAE